MPMFAKNARVNLPALAGSAFIGAQAVVIDSLESIPGFPVYTLRWLDDAGETHTGTCGEGDLNDANCPLVAQLGADTMPAAGEGARTIAFKAARKRKPAKKSATKRRR